MNPPLRTRIKALLAQPDRPLSDLRLVMMANGGTAFGGAIVACIAFSWPFATVAAVTPLLFLGLCACLLFKYSFWIPAVFVGLANAAALALVLGYYGSGLHPALRWPAAVIGFLVPLVSTFRMFGRVAEGARHPAES
jgi:hypothetical protein